MIGVADETIYDTPALMGSADIVSLRVEINRHIQESLDALVAELPQVRGYRALRAVLAGGVSGQVIRTAHCPVMIVPRSVDRTFGKLLRRPNDTPLIHPPPRAGVKLHLHLAATAR